MESALADICDRNHSPHYTCPEFDGSYAYSRKYFRKAISNLSNEQVRYKIRYPDVSNT